MTRTTWLAALIVVALASGHAAGRQTSKPAAAEKLPPLSYVCIMAGDEDIIEDKPGKCRKCGMDLHPIRLDSVWTCPVHAAVIKDAAGKCPIDGRPLIPVTMSVSWACAGSSTLSPTPGTCPDGRPMERRYAPRAHGNHNPQHGGGFFMAPDSWHHLEGTYFPPGTFRLYLYDDFTKPLPLTKLRTISAHIVLADGKSIPLVRNGRVLEARIGKQPFPLAVQAQVTFEPSAKENSFDFTFESFSRDLPAPSATTTTTANTGNGTTSPARPASIAAAPATAASPASTLLETATGDPGFTSIVVADTVPEMLAQLTDRDRQIKALIDRGAFASVYVPAFQAKDVALALDAKKTGLPADRQKLVEPAVNRLIRGAYLLDAFGDLGNKQQIQDAYSRFAAAVQDLTSAFPKQPQ